MIEKVKHSGLALAVLAAAQFMVVLDATIVNVALPAIRDTLGFASDSQLQWVVTAYALVFGGFLLLGGRLADLFGRRRMFLAGVSLFAAASLLGGIAQGPAELIVFRALQGLGGAMLAPSALSLVLSIFAEGPARNKALGIWSMVAAGGGAVGLIVGGLLTQYVNWRWTFFINVPIGITVLILALQFVPQSLPTSKQRVDILGALTITGGLMSLVYALVKAPDAGWTAASTLGTFGLSALLLTIFIVNEHFIGKPLVPLGIFKRRNVSGGALVMLLMPAAMFGMFFYLSIYLQQILHYSPTMTGVANLPFTITIMVIAGVLSRKIAEINPKPVLVIAPLITMSGLFFFSRIPVTAHYWTDILPGVVMMAAGMAGVFVTATLVATSGVEHHESGLVSGLLNTGQQIGGALGLAVLSVISTTVTKDDLAHAASGLSTVVPATVHGFQRGFFAAAFFAIAASTIALLVIKTKKPSAQAADNEAENEAEALAAIPGA